MRFVMTAEPAPLPSLLHVLPPSSVPQSPALATPAMTILEHGFAETRPRLPHSDAMFARLPVAFAHAAGGAATLGAGSAHWNESEPPPSDPAPPDAPPALDPAAPAASPGGRPAA